MPDIVLKQATKYYRGEKRLEIGVKDVDLTIEQGEFVFIIGSSGAGKSTLVNLITGQLRPDRGEFFLGDKNLWKISGRSRNRRLLVMGKVWQEPSLIRKRTVRENLEMAARITLQRTETPVQRLVRIQKVLGLVGMRGVEGKYPVELSVGECRRVELARALINSPPILVLDEITANLDDDTIWDIMHLLSEVNRRGATVIMVTHASQYVNIMRRRVVTLVDGKVFGDVKKGRYGNVV